MPTAEMESLHESDRRTNDDSEERAYVDQQEAIAHVPREYQQESDKEREQDVRTVVGSHDCAQRRNRLLGRCSPGTFKIHERIPFRKQPLKNAHRQLRIAYGLRLDAVYGKLVANHFRPFALHERSYEFLVVVEIQEPVAELGAKGELAQFFRDSMQHDGFFPDIADGCHAGRALPRNDEAEFARRKRAAGLPGFRPALTAQVSPQQQFSLRDEVVIKNGRRGWH